MAGLCLSRSKNAPLNVGLTIRCVKYGFFGQSYDFAYHGMLLDALHHSKRWSRVDIQFDRAEADNLGHDFVVGSDIRREFRELNAPSLESLFIRGPGESLKYLTEAFGELQGWNAPCIRHITSRHYFPLRLPGLANVANLNLELDLAEVNLNDILESVSQMKALEDLEFTLVGLSILVEIHRVERAILLGVKRLQVNIQLAGRHHFSSSSSLKSFFSYLFFPRAVDLHINLKGLLRDFYPKEGHAEVCMVMDMMCIFQHPEQYPAVQSFRLKVFGAGYSPPGKSLNSIDRISLVVPLGMLPSVKCFDLSSNCRLLLLGDDGRGDAFFRQHTQYSWETWLPGAPGMASPALEIISINIVKDRPLIRFIADIMQKQKERGDWAMFRKLVVLDTSGNRTGDRSEYIGEAALQWCVEQGE